MKNKLLIGFAVISIVLVSIWGKFANHSSQKTIEEILNDDYKKIAKNLDSKNTSSDEWKEINNYSKTPEELVTVSRAGAFFKAAHNNLPDIYTCLKKDFCGMGKSGPKDSYFDDKKTPAHILINRSLKIVKESLIKDSSLSSEVNWNLLQELASSDSEELCIPALDIIRDFNREITSTNDLIKLTKNYTGFAKAQALIKISKNEKPLDKIMLVSEIEEVFKVKDPDTVINVLESLETMSLSGEQMTRVLKNLCHYKNNPDEERNWLMIKYQAKKLDPDFEKACN